MPPSPIELANKKKPTTAAPSIHSQNISPVIIACFLQNPRKHSGTSPPLGHRNGSQRSTTDGNAKHADTTVGMRPQSLMLFFVVREFEILICGAIR